MGYWKPLPARTMGDRGGRIVEHRAHRILGAEREQMRRNAVRLRGRGWSLTATAERLHCAPNTVRALLVEPVAPNTAVELYRAGASLAVVAAALRRSDRAARQIIVDAGVAIRPAHRPAR